MRRHASTRTQALTLFAQRKYKDAASAIYAVLAAGPGWDWQTMSELYPDPEVYTKQLPDEKGDWELSLMKPELMENIMPIVSVGIARETFAERRTGLIFDDGELVECVGDERVVCAQGSASNIQRALEERYGLRELAS